MDDYLAGLTTEGINEDTRNIDLCSTEEMVDLINRQDALVAGAVAAERHQICLLYTSPSPRDLSTSRMPSSA